MQPVMSRACLVMLAVAGLLFAGCAGPQWTGEMRPADWRHGVVLESYRGGKAHNGNEGYDLRPTANTTVGTPFKCVAYQNGRVDALDHCTVFGAGQFVPSEYEENQHAHWVLVATWDGTGERLYEDVELHPEGRTVVAFDGAGAIVAFWDGLLRAAGEYSTE